MAVDVALSVAVTAVGVGGAVSSEQDYLSRAASVDVRFWGEADMNGRSGLGGSVAIDPNRTSARLGLVSWMFDRPTETTLNWLERKFGFVCDNLVEVELATSAALTG